jgi:hypothetical protein
MKFKYKNIGLSGVAGCGKNTVCDIITKFLNRLDLPYNELSIARNLKKEVSETCKKLYDIDSINCSREEKEIIRPFLVSHGQIRRNLSSGRHWIDRLGKELDPEKINIITDIRFNEYDKDECYWIKNEINGVLVHISRFDNINGKRVFVPPANEAERENDPKVKAESDFILNWPTEHDSNLKIFNCKKLLNWIKNIYA